MNQDPARKLTYSTAHKVLKFLEQQDVPATPENYIIFYLYFDGEHKGLVDMVRKHFEASLPWTSETTNRVFNLLFGPESNLQFFRSRESISRQIKEMTSGIVAETRSTADLADKSSRVIENKLGNVRALTADEQSQHWFNDVISELEGLGELSHRLGGSLRLKTGRLQEFVDTLNSMERMALTDELTQLANRRAWNTVVKESFAKFGREGKSSTLLMIDLDDFKRINDRFGHPVGDEALRAVARILIKGLRGEDFPARYGGEEFVALMPGTNLEGGTRVAERLRKAIENTPFTVRGNAITITASFGLASFREADQDPDETLQRADQALYLAKSKGKNLVCSETDLAAAANEPT